MPDISSAHGHAPVRRLRAGIVEDAPGIVTILDYNLTMAGYLVEVMACGDRAAEQLQEQPPDLLILDWMLPGVSGALDRITGDSYDSRTFETGSEIAHRPPMAPTRTEAADVAAFGGELAEPCRCPQVVRRSPRAAPVSRVR